MQKHQDEIVHEQSIGTTLPGGSLQGSTHMRSRGQPPLALLQYILGTAKVQMVEDALYDRDQVIQLLKYHFAKTQSRMKFYVDKS